MDLKKYTMKQAINQELKGQIRVFDFSRQSVMAMLHYMQINPR